MTQPELNPAALLDLYEALKAMVAAFENDKHITARQRGKIGPARAALAKAEGRTP